MLTLEELGYTDLVGNIRIPLRCNSDIRQVSELVIPENYWARIVHYYNKVELWLLKQHSTTPTMITVYDPIQHKLRKFMHRKNGTHDYAHRTVTAAIHHYIKRMEYYQAQLSSKLEKAVHLTSMFHHHINNSTISIKVDEYINDPSTLEDIINDLSHCDQ